MGRTKEDKLVEAVIDDNFREVTSLLAKGAPVGIDIINSLLYYAARDGHIRLVELLTVAHSADPTEKALAAGVEGGKEHHCAVVALLEAAAKMSPQERAKPGRLWEAAKVRAPDAMVKAEEAKLCQVAYDGDVVAAASLLAAGVRVNGHVDGPDGFTPLQMAVAYGKGNPTMLALLLSHGADVNARDEHDRTALDLLKENEYDATETDIGREAVALLEAPEQVSADTAAAVAAALAAAVGSSESETSCGAKDVSKKRKAPNKPESKKAPKPTKASSSTKTITVRLTGCSNGVGMSLDESNIVDMLRPRMPAIEQIKLGDKVISWNTRELVDAAGAQIKLKDVVNTKLDSHTLVIERSII